MYARVVAALVIVLAAVACDGIIGREHGSARVDANADARWSFEPNPRDDPSCAGLVGCGPARHCEPQCVPDGTDGCLDRCKTTCDTDTRCETIDCGPGRSCSVICTTECGSMAQQCYRACASNGDAGLCTGTITCATPMPSCPASTTAGIVGGCYSGFCIPTAACGARDPGGCDASTVTCADPRPVCPASTTPGVSGTCWSGYCIPDFVCTCERLGTESSCLARSDCVAIYRGASCTCPALSSCSCEDENVGFERCRGRGAWTSGSSSSR